MSLGRGIQSAIFYYLSCAPCTKAAHRRNRKKQLNQDRKQREALFEDDPTTYRQPSPYRTNEYWAEEIRLGPGPPERRLPKKERKKRREEDAAGRGRSAVRADNQQDAQEKKLELPRLPEPAHLSGLRGILKNTENRFSGLDWRERWRRFQREDEDLWGGESSSDESDSSSERPRLGPPRQSVAGSSIGVPGPFHMRLHQHHSKKRPEEGYWTARNPPVNDLHPPVVSVPTRSRASNQWMLQPPPPSGVMNGYTPISRNRSDSENSRAPGARQTKRVRLDRDISVRLIEEKLALGEIENAEGGGSLPAPLQQSLERSAVSDGTFDDHRLQKQSDSGVDVTGSSDQSRTSQDGTTRHDFAFTDGRITQAQGLTKKHSTKRKPRTSTMSSSKESVVGTSIGKSKKASRVAMPTPYASQLPQSSNTRKNSAQRPRLSRVFSNPEKLAMHEYRSISQAQLDGTSSTQMLLHQTQLSPKPHSNNFLDEDDNEADTEEDLVDPLDARARRKRGVTESAGRQRGGTGTTGAAFWGERWQPETTEWNYADEDIEDEDKGVHTRLVLRMPSMQGRRWSFDL